MKKCPKCGFENEFGGIDCPQCGIVYEKFDAMLKKETEAEAEAEDNASPEPEASESEPEAAGQAEGDLPEALKMMEYDTDKSFDWGRIKDGILDFVVAQKKWLIGAVCIVCLVIAGVVIATSGLKGKKGVVNWSQILGEGGGSALLFDYVDLLPEPRLPEEDTSPDLQVNLCDVPSGTRVRVVSVLDDFLEIEVLEGDCEGEVGYILSDHFVQD